MGFGPESALKLANSFYEAYKKKEFEKKLFDSLDQIERDILIIKEELSYLIDKVEYIASWQRFTPNPLVYIA